MTEYRNRPTLDKLEPYYSRHISAMTTEDLFSKSDIAAELAVRDKRIAELETDTIPALFRERDQANKRIANTLDVISGSAPIAGTRKEMQWVVDQALRALLENSYDDWVGETLIDDDGDIIWEEGTEP